MRTTRHRVFGTTGRRAGALLAAAVLALGIGASGGSAAEPPPPPDLESVEVIPPAGIKFTVLTSSTEPIDGIRLNVYQNGAFRRAFNTPLEGMTHITVTIFQRPDVFRPNTRYCVGLLAYVGTGDNNSSTFSEESQRRCFTMPVGAGNAGAPAPAPAPPPPTKPDLAVTRVSGPTELFNGTAAVYEVVLANDGAAATGTAQITIYAAGGLDAEEMVEIPAGFTCEDDPIGFSCTGSLGGVDDPIQTQVAIFKVRMRGVTPGPASVEGRANNDGSLDEMSEPSAQWPNVQRSRVTVK